MLAVLASLPLPQLTAGSEGWEPVVTRDGISIAKNLWGRSEHSAAPMAVKSQCTVQVPAETLALLLCSRNDTIAREFNPTFDCGQDLAWTSPCERISYIRTKAVWPLRPRDFVCRVKYERTARSTC